MTKLLLHKSKRRVGSPGVFITPGTYFMIALRLETVLRIEVVLLLARRLQIRKRAFLISWV